ncbi:MAG TPA: acetylglutamate kinase, partial [Longimicrobiales bacterium]|nr:acetylglutamate kinase [Longimicrobiales bacterium]
MVVKVGGAALADAAWLERFAACAAHSSAPLLIVHGGGPEISALSQALGIPVEWHEGRRVTTPAVLDAAAMVLTGLINKRLVAALVCAGVDAIGLSGIDGGLVRAAIARDGTLGRVGRVSAVRAGLLQRLSADGSTIVLSPISLGEDGGALNVNADEVAAAVAIAVGASELVFLTDVAGVRGAGGVAAALGAREAAELVASGAASGGMAVKLAAACSALEAGVSAVRIGDLETLTSASAGTVLRRSLEAVA